jgi:hypothetical protein
VLDPATALFFELFLAIEKLGFLGKLMKTERRRPVFIIGYQTQKGATELRNKHGRAVTTTYLWGSAYIKDNG